MVVQKGFHQFYKTVEINGKHVDAEIDFFRDKHEITDDGLLGRINYYAENDAEEKILYGKIDVVSTDVSDGTEDADMSFWVMINGTLTRLFFGGSGGITYNQNVTYGDNVTIAGLNRAIGAILVERTTSCTVAKFADAIVPDFLAGASLIDVKMTCTTAGVTSTMVGNIEKNGTDMLSTGVSIDTTETTSETAATPPVIKSDGTEVVAAGDVLTFEITQIHSGTAALGCSIVAEFK